MAESLKTSSSKPASTAEEPIVIELANPIFAGILSWFVPGLGHYYQKRYFKAVLFALCVIPTFLYGCYLGSGKEVGIARNVYYSWRKDDRRYYFIPQCGLGMAAIPALIQYQRASSGQRPFCHGLMAPPTLFAGGDAKFQGYPPTLDEIISKLGGNFEIGTIYTVVAGLMNLLVIFDAVDGPIFSRKEDEETESNKKETDKEKDDKAKK